jgi:AAA+ ATPase superfamily predicted ATPase
MFIGREKELSKLNEMYASDSFEFAVIYGRKRVGKTTLIREFCKDKKAIYFIAREANDIINIENFSKDVFNVTSKETAGTAKFPDWEKAFEYIYNLAKNERLILVIDEYPYLAQANRSISSIIQAHIDMKFKDSKLFLILCGSSMSFMEYQVLSYKSPLYGRRTSQFKIKPFTFFESIKYHKEFTNEEKAIIYGITGGIPEYLSKIKEGKSLKDNIIDMFLNENGHLFLVVAVLLVLLAKISAVMLVYMLVMGILCMVGMGRLLRQLLIMLLAGGILIRVGGIM